MPSGKSLKVTLEPPAEGGPNQHNPGAALPDGHPLRANRRTTARLFYSHGSLGGRKSSDPPPRRSAGHIQTFQAAQKLPPSTAPARAPSRTSPTSYAAEPAPGRSRLDRAGFAFAFLEGREWHQSWRPHFPPTSGLHGGSAASAPPRDGGWRGRSAELPGEGPWETRPGDPSSPVALRPPLPGRRGRPAPQALAELPVGPAAPGYALAPRSVWLGRLPASPSPRRHSCSLQLLVVAVGGGGVWGLHLMPIECCSLHLRRFLEVLELP